MTALGFLIGFGIFIGAILSECKEAWIFINPHGLLVVLGGVLAATFVGFPFQEVKRLLTTTWLIFRRPEEKYQDVVRQFGEWAELVGRKGIGALEPEIEQLPQSFIRDGLELLINGYSHEEIKENLETSLQNFTLRERTDVNIYKSMAALAPAFGLVGTLIGLITMLRNMEDVSHIAKSMSTAMTATFYGVISSNLIFTPIANKLARRIEFKTIYHRMVSDGILMLHEKRHPLFLMDKMNTYLAPRNRVVREKGQKGEKAAAGKR